MKLYRSGVPTGTLAPYLNLTILMGTGTTGTGGTFASCTGFSSTGTIYSGTLADFATNRTDYASGVTAWDPVGGPETRTFLFRISVVDTPAAEGLNSTFGFSWETRTS